MKKKIFFLLLVAYACFVSACFWLDCEGLVSLSPEELLESNEYVLLGNFVSADTIVNLGTVSYLGSEAGFSIIEYVFRPNRIYKGERNLQKVYLWNCEHLTFNTGFSTVLDLAKAKSYLVYGNTIQQNEDIMNVMRPMTYVDELKRILQGMKSSRPLVWNTLRADSIIATRIMKNDSLSLLLGERNLKGQVIFGVDSELGTFEEFKNGVLCYYANGRPRTIQRAAYMKKLDTIAMSSSP